MEEAARLAGQGYDKYLTETLPDATRKLYEADTSPEAMVKYQQTLNSFTKDINDGYMKATNELVSLRIVCSNQLAVQLDDFEETYKAMMNLQPQMLEEIRQSLTLESFITGQFNFETPSKIKMITLGASLVETRNMIIKSMRKELGFEK